MLHGSKNKNNIFINHTVLCTFYFSNFRQQESNPITVPTVEVLLLLMVYTLQALHGLPCTSNKSFISFAVRILALIFRLFGGGEHVKTSSLLHECVNVNYQNSEKSYENMSQLVTESRIDSVVLFKIEPVLNYLPINT
jgi:hypothetical protein